MGKIVGLTFKKKAFVCPVCGKEYQSESTLEKHIKEKHTDDTNKENAG